MATALPPCGLYRTTRVIEAIPADRKNQAQKKESGLRLVEQRVRKLIEAGFTAEPVCQSGNRAQEIMNVAAKHQADLIVMGAKGLGAIDRFLLGSVSTRVVEQANCSVLVVR